MMTLSRLLKLQWLYVILGAGYNLVSFFVVQCGGQQLSTTDPLVGGPVMLGYGGFLMAAHYGHFRLYRILMALSLLIFGWGGIIVHLMNYLENPGLYASFMAWGLAVGINVFGIGLSLIALSGRFTTFSRAGGRQD